MKIKIYEDRSYSRENFSNEGTENENLATTLYFQFPETVNGVETSTLNKYIVFDINGEPNTDILTSNNSYSIPTAITQLGTVSFNIYLVAPTNNGEDSPFRWISKKITLNFNDANEMTEIVITVEEINIFNSLLSELNDAIANIELLEEDFEEFKGDYDDLKKDFEDLNSDFLILNQNYQAAIQQVENVNIDANKINDTATVTITNKDGIQKEVTIKDGIDYEITSEDYQEIANIVEQDITPLIPTKVSQLENDSAYIKKEVNNLTNYYKKSETYTKQEVDNKVASVYKYKGTVASYNNLPSTGLTIGDVYNVEDTGDNYAWTGTDWDKLGGDIDLSGYQEKIDNSHKLNADLVDDSNSINKFTSATEKNSWNAKYNKPSGGIPSTDMSSSVQTSLRKADTALQAHQDISGKEDSSNKVTSIDENSTDTQYPSAKTVYDNFVTRDEEIEKLQTENAQLLADHPDILDENNEFPSGTDLILNGTGDLEMSVDVGGNSTQVQYEGYNLLPILNTSQTVYGVTFTINEDGTILVNGTASEEVNFVLSNIAVSLEGNENYTLTGCPSGGSNTSYALWINQAGSLVDFGNGVTQTIASDGRTANGIIKIRSGTVCNNLLFKPMITKGTDLTKSYEPFVGNSASPNPNYKQDINNVEGDVVVKGSSKNLFDESILNLYKVDEDNEAYIYDTTTLRGKNLTSNITFKENTSYTIQYIAKQTSGNPRLEIVYTDETTQSIGSTVISSSYTKYTQLSDSSKTIDYITGNWGNSILKGFYIKKNSLQIEEGTTATPYVPHAENTVTFPLSQGQKLMLGDYLADDGIHHKRIYTKLNANDNWVKNGTRYELDLDNYSNGKHTILCSHFVETENWTEHTTSVNNTIILYKSASWDKARISINTNDFSTLNEFKQFITDNNVYVEYELATETTESYTEAQQTAYNKLKEMQSYYDLTYVVGSSDNAQPILTAHAKKSIKQLSGGDLSNYQTKITSTNKLNSDLVNDTNQTNKFVTTSEKNTWNAKQNTTDNNLATTNKNITSAINEVNSIAKGANQALSYASYSAMITAFNSASSTDYNVGQNIYIETLEVPDLWVYKVESTSSSYTYTTDSAFTTALETNGYVQVGYYKLSALETQKVDLTNYVENTDYANATTGGVVKVSILTQSEYEQLQTIDTNTFYMIKEV